MVKSLRVGLALALAASTLILLIPSQGQGSVSSLARSGLSGTAKMETVSLPARIVKVATVPGTGGREAWAVGHLSAKRPGWDTSAAQGQLVFLHLKDSEWSLEGPPSSSSGTDKPNPLVSSLSLAESGEGWAVGYQGALLHHPPGGGWNYVSACGTIIPSGCPDLTSVSIRSGPDGVYGFAVGTQGTILRLAAGSWSVDTHPIVSSQTPDLAGVYTVSASEAWAIGNDSSRSLQILRRDALSWTRETTNQPIFDSPAPSSQGSSVNLAALGASIIGEPGTSAIWIGGGIYPVDPGQPFGQPQTPFTLMTDGNANAQGDYTFTSFCPQQYTLSNDQISPNQICQQTMPASGGPITSMSMVQGHLFAGGRGLFHYKDGWLREPDSVGFLSSVAFGSPTEGWVASAGNTEQINAVVSSSRTIGHFTRSPSKSRVARWPSANTFVLHAVAVAPGGATALAVGDQGAMMLYRRGVGWDRVPKVTNSDLHAVAWSGQDEAWVVGNEGTIIQYRRGRATNIRTSPTSRALFGIAFNRGRGIAVGAEGTVLSFNGSSWAESARLGDATLFSVAPSGGGFVAAGEGGAVLVSSSPAGTDWAAQDAAREAATVPGRGAPTFYAVRSLNDGTILVAGAGGTVLEGHPGRNFAHIAPFDGASTVLDIDGVRTSSGQLRLIASVSRDAAKFQGTKVSVTESVLFLYDGGRWKDIQLNNRQTVTQAQTQDQQGTHPIIDTGARADPILSVAMEPGGSRGWGVGGTSARLLDDEHHINSIPTSSTYRFDLTGDPAPPFVEASARKYTPGTFSFAYIADSGCGFGPCSVGLGSGMTADEVLLKAREDINEFAKLPDGPKFVVFGGNVRSIGIPEDLAAFKGYIDGFDIPVFAAIGQSDLLALNSGAAGLLPDLSNQNLNNVFDPSSARGQVAASNRYFMEAFADEAPPWGTTRRDDDIFKDVGTLGVEATRGKARTHYAFDYRPKGRSLARFIFLDTSDKNFTKGAALNQNPRGEDQPGWFATVAGTALAQDPPIPLIVISNVPTQNPTLPVRQSRTGMMTDGATLESAATGASAVLTGSVRTNAVYYVPDAQSPVRVPYFVLGSGGSPIGGNSNPVPTDGRYHAWHLVDVDTRGISLTNPKAAVEVTAIPVIESVALSAPNGLTVPGGNGLNFTGLARAVEGGGPPDRPEQAQRMYLNFPWPDECPENEIGPHYGQCRQVGTLVPDYHFISEDESYAVFVKRGPAPGLPLIIDTPQGKRLVADDKSGFLCTLKYGTVHVKIVSGLHQMRMPVNIEPGTGPCVEYPILRPPAAPIRNVPTIQTIEPLQEAPFKPLFNPPPLPEPLVIVLPPAPGPIAAPAPPASAASSRKEEEEAELERQGEEDGSAQFTALRNNHRRQLEELTVIYIGSAATLLAIMALGFAVSLYRRVTYPKYARQRR